MDSEQSRGPDVAEVIAGELGLSRRQVDATRALFAGGATVPFVARYRKEATGNLDEVQLGAIAERGRYLEELAARRETVLGTIGEQGKLTPELEARIVATLSKTELEDLYLPFRPKRRTRASMARERGLAPLAELILSQARGLAPRDQLAAPFVDAERGVPDVEAAWAGARDIVAETIAEQAALRGALRTLALERGTMRTKVVAGKEVEGAKFKDYFEFEEGARTLPSHRILALRRGEKEGFLEVRLEVDAEAALAEVRRHAVRDPGASLSAELSRALVDSWERLLAPAIEVDVRLALKERADADAIRVFAENLRHLILAAPLGEKRVLGVDPGFRTGCKLALLDETGKLLAHDVVFPAQGEARTVEAGRKLEALCRAHRVEAIAVGNGTGGRETESFLRGLSREGRLGAAQVVSVNESGASVYSASEVARRELPDEDVTVRGAVSIGRRLQDPLAELVKIDPKAIGVGQYQHDVHQPTLERSLTGVVESCVNAVGVDVNTASPTLLRHVAGIGETLADNIVAFRADNGRFASRAALKKVPRLGPRAFEQAAGFLRVRGDHPLDASAVHPESYDVVERMARDLGVGVRELVGNEPLIARIEIARYVDETRGEPTLRDILAELRRPGRDPRAQFEAVAFRDDVTEFEHVQEGMLLDGVVTNVTRFGAFVDVGVHHDGLVHISELSHRFVRDPSEAVKVGDRVKVKVLQIDRERRRLGLSIKQATAPPATSAAPGGRPGERPASRPGERPQGERSQGERAPARGDSGARPPASRGGERRPRHDNRDPTHRPPDRPPAGPSSRPPAAPFNSIRIKPDRR